MDEYFPSPEEDSPRFASASMQMREPQPAPGHYTAGYNTPEGATFPLPLSPGTS
ncbi:hypothetical protein E4U12_001938 [Claviceps purpurea]|nr:hypothetical protein E4U12_001938 [Claviceps purpurea]